MNLFDLLKSTERAELIRHNVSTEKLQSIQITSITDDSRQAGPNVLFCATKNGRKFIDQATQAGSLLLVSNSTQIQENYANIVLRCASPDRTMGWLSSAFEGNPSSDLKIVAVTGTNGKTTTTHILYYLWKKAGFRCALIGTLGVKSFDGSHESVWQTGFTTPRSYELHSILKQFKQQQISLIAIEASSEALALGRLEGLSVSCILFTGLGRDHLNFHRTLESYMRAKRHLFFLADRSNHSIKAFVFTGEINQTKNQIKKQEEEIAYYQLSRFKGRCNQSIEWLTESEINSIAAKSQPVPTYFNRVNAALALCSLSATSQFSKPILTDFDGVPGRMQRIKVSPAVDAFVDYAHSPDSLERVLSEIKFIGYDYSIVVFGCGGDRDKGKRPLMGRIAAQLADSIFITDDNQRTENADQIRLEIMAGIQSENLTGSKQKLIFNIGNREIAIVRSLEYAISKPGKVAVIIAGKGHETYQIIGKTKHHFSDIEVVEKFVKKLD
ncbi:MAG: UDP-N-acetylmuramoyl-L-alanyl-D-glutamate--2,6-diaminopimelate ligase [Leptonema sp. (in: Bacteria)]|nr:UDP-N-acetylmuramoyl-L-alanyl-D-glutamate--2,6-diaminopimelate ligase [Leptonema sp. (in: bacteria)]